MVGVHLCYQCEIYKAILGRYQQGPPVLLVKEYSLPNRSTSAVTYLKTACIKIKILFPCSLSSGSNTRQPVATTIQTWQSRCPPPSSSYACPRALACSSFAPPSHLILTSAAASQHCLGFLQESQPTTWSPAFVSILRRLLQCWLTIFWKSYHITFLFKISQDAK